MRNILKKEMILSAAPITYFFIVFGLMFLLPGYPILCGAFFVTLGIFKTFQNSREANDFVYSVLLPVAKSDVVKGKYLFSCFIELCSFFVMAAAVLVRMTFWKDAMAYRHNALMNANPYALGAGLVVFGLFNFIFIGTFFKTAYKFGSFIVYIIISILVIGAFESVHYFPGFAAVNAFGFDDIVLQLVLLGSGIVLYVILTLISYRRAKIWFEKIDL